MSNIMSNESFINRVEGLADVLDTTITKVTLNGSEMETEPLAQLGFGDASGNVSVQGFLDFLESENSGVADEFFGNLRAFVEDGHLFIEPRNIGSKG